MLFQKPREIMVAATADQYLQALDAAEAARRGGLLLEPRLAGLLPDGRRGPLAVLGIFDGPSETIRAEPAPAPTNGPIFDARAAWSLQDYERRFGRLHQHLRQGDCYQANLTFPVRAAWSGEPLAAFDALIARQPVKYGALVALAEPVVLSRSPELFFSIDAEGTIETHPMKGTSPRGSTPDEDRQFREFLLEDEKTQAENRMIVDLLRNDVSLISEVGTLDVPELFRIETYPTVHQMVSRVRARLRRDVTIAQIFAALFPCGSVTGAPKIRAMQILRELEDGPREAYCGAIGWIAPGGPMRFSVAIRTLSLFRGGEAVYNVGGGVVFDSTAEAEYEECLLKAKFATGTVPASG
jgi:para-aminobenzoate synthetase component 1